MLMGSFRYVQCVVDFILWPASDQDRQNMLASRLRFPDNASRRLCRLLTREGWRGQTYAQGGFAHYCLDQQRASGIAIGEDDHPPDLPDALDALPPRSTPTRARSPDRSPASTAASSRAFAGLSSAAAAASTGNSATGLSTNSFRVSDLTAPTASHTTALDLSTTRTNLSFALIDLLTDPDFDAAPEEIAVEKMRMSQRKISNPLYGYAAVQLPSLCASNWDDVGDLCTELFTSPGNFAQWTMEYTARLYSAHELGDVASLPGRQPEPFLDTWEVLAGGTVSPLHFAAALGLPQLCRVLIEEYGGNVKADHTSKLGTPLIFALVGPRILEDAQSKSVWSYWKSLHEEPFSIQQQATIDLLIDFDADCLNLPTKIHGLSLGCMALMACVRLGHPPLLARLIDSNLDLLEPDVIDMLDHVSLGYPYSSSALRPAQQTQVEGERGMLGQDMWHDHCRCHAPGVEDRGGDGVGGKRRGSCSRLHFSQPRKNELPCSRVQYERPALLTDDEYWRFVLDAVAYDGRANVAFLKFLMQDHRWDPNACLGSITSTRLYDAEGKTVLHIAVDSSHISAVKLLLEKRFGPCAQRPPRENPAAPRREYRRL